MTRLVHACLLAFAVVLLWSAEARADESADVARAKELFENGNGLLDGDKFEQALHQFRASHALRAGAGNTRNMAHCLGMLDRWDEALEMYDELLGRFGAQLAVEDRDVVKRFMTAYRKRVGYLDISANVNGQILVDGRHRGLLPLSAALYVLPGEHLLRILKEGYAPYEKTLKIAVGQTTTLDAQLHPLVSVGRLRVEVDPKGKLASGGRLWIDGSPVDGALPWEGNLAPGPHVLFASSDDAGSALVRVVVVQSQLVTTTLTARRLGAPLLLRVGPPTARISIDGIELGQGGFEGRLPVGDHEIVVREDGYASTEFKIHSSLEGAQDRRVSLVVDPTHPRWSSGARFRLEAFAAPLFGASLRSDAEVRAGGTLAYGGMFAVRFGFELPVRLAVDVSGGWLGVARTVTRSFERPFTASQQLVPVRYDVQDGLRAHGPFVGLGVRQRLSFGGDRFDLRLGMGLAHGVLSARDVSSTMATSTGMSTPATTDRNGVPTTTVTLFLTPEVDARYRLGPVEIGVGLGVVAVLFEGNALSEGETRVHGCPRTTPSDVRCAPGTRILDGERSFGRFTAWAPRLSVGWTFF